MTKNSAPSPRPRLVTINHDGGEFIARFNFAGTEAEAIQVAIEAACDRWNDLEPQEAHIATDGDIRRCQGQFVELGDL